MNTENPGSSPEAPAPQWVRTSAHTAMLTVPNPGGMTLEGTNTYLVGELGEQFPPAPGQPLPEVLVVDPGPQDPRHAQALAQAGQVQAVLVTHRHEDHLGNAALLAQLTGAPVRTWDPELSQQAPALTDGEVITVGGLEVLVLHTPGHTQDSVCFQVEADAVMLTGDTILGRGSTMLDDPDGRLEDYLDSLRDLRDFGTCTVLPAHGPHGAVLEDACAQLLDRRIDRIQQILAWLKEEEADIAPSAQELTDRFYGQVPEDVRPSAVKTIRAQLAYLVDLGEIAGFTD